MNLPLHTAPTTTLNDESVVASPATDFSLVVGGPLYQCMLRARLIEPSVRHVPRRVLVSILITWLPLAVLTALAGTFAGKVGVPFLYDLGNVRFLIAIPILIGAELVVHRRMRSMVAQFLERGLVAPEDRRRFEGFIAQAMKLRNSVAVEIVLVLLSSAALHRAWSARWGGDADTWYAVLTNGSVAFTAAGYWYAFVSLPIARFLLLRWYYRLFIWYVFLWRVSRLPLQLNPLHPDRAGGLAFLGNTVIAIAPVLFAQMAFFSAMIGNEIWHGGATLPQFQFEIAGVMAFLMLVVFLPLTFFVFQLNEARLAVSREFGRLGSRYANEFRHKWLQGGATADEELLGTADIQSMADLGNSFETIRSMRMFPFGRAHVIHLAAILAVPLVPLVMTMIPLEELAQRVFRLIL